MKTKTRRESFDPIAQFVTGEHDVSNATPEPRTDDPDQMLIEASIPDADGPVYVTPEIAELWLQRNVNNRPIRAARVASLARDMDADHWKYTGEAIKFDTEGNLLDGQHRLAAVVKSGATVKMLVVIGLEASAQNFMDAGARRSAGDALSFRGEVQSLLLASTCRLGLAVERIKATGRDAFKEQVTHAEVIEWLTLHPDIRRYVQHAARVRNRVDMKPSVLAYALYRMAERSEEDTVEFLGALVDMRSEGPGDPIYTLLQRLRNARRTRERLSQLNELYFIARAWNAYRSAQPLKALKVPPNELEIARFI